MKSTLKGIIGTIVDAGIWINVECNIGIVSACLPVMRPLLKYTSRTKPLSAKRLIPETHEMTIKSPKKGLADQDHSIINDSVVSVDEDKPQETGWFTGPTVRPDTRTYRSIIEEYSNHSSV